MCFIIKFPLYWICWQYILIFRSISEVVLIIHVPLYFCELAGGRCNLGTVYFCFAFLKL